MNVRLFWGFWALVFWCAGSLQAVPTIRKLDSRPLEQGRHDFYLQVDVDKEGHALDIPVMVLKGAHEGKTLLLTAAIHGDELNGIRIIHRLFTDIDPAILSGTIVAVPGVNQLGIQADSRFFSFAEGAERTDLNRVFPGDKESDNPASVFAAGLWHALIKNNSDVAIDLHTQSEGATYPLFVFADFGSGAAMSLAYALLPDIIKNDPGQKGTLETALLQEGVPSVTFEVGGPDRFQHHLVDRAKAGVMNAMRLYKMLPGSVQKSLIPPYVTSDFSDVTAVEGGYVVIETSLLATLKKGDHVATIYDPFGNEVRRYYAPYEGKVLAVSTQPLKSAGAMLVRIAR